MSAPGSRAIVSRQDIETAQAVIDVWVEMWPQTDATAPLSLPQLRGLITQALADAHSTGYDQGVLRGRQLIAHTVRDALEGEGL